MVDRTPLEPPPIVVVVMGPPKVGKSTLIRCLIRNFTRQKLTEIRGPVTIVSGKECCLGAGLSSIVAWRITYLSFVCSNRKYNTNMFHCIANYNCFYWVAYNFKGNFLDITMLMYTTLVWLVDFAKCVSWNGLALVSSLWAHSFHSKLAPVYHAHLLFFSKLLLGEFVRFVSVFEAGSLCIPLAPLEHAI